MSSEDVRAALTSESVKSLLARKSFHLCRRPGFQPSDRQDLEHDLIVHVLQQAGRFDPLRGSPTAFIATVLNSTVAMMIRARHRIKRGRGHVVISLESTNVFCEGRRELTLAHVVTEEDLRRRCGGRVRGEQEQGDEPADIPNAIVGLAPGLKKIALRLADNREAAVARGLGISRRQVRNAKKAIREHLRDHGILGI